MHLAFTWEKDEGLWVFVNGEVNSINRACIDYPRVHNRYNRITLGRSNANNKFGNFLSFAFQEVAVYESFTVAYRMRERFAMAGESSH